MLVTPPNSSAIASTWMPGRARPSGIAGNSHA
jgi:hypothetical protein